MRKHIILLIILLVLIVPVSAMEFTAPEVPQIGEDMMPQSYDSFGEGLWYVIRTALGALQPSFKTACGTCLSVMAVLMLSGLVRGMAGGQEKTIRLIETLMVTCLFLQRSEAFFQISWDVIYEISNYGKLLLPVMAASLAAQGGVTGAAGIYGGTLLFDTILTSAITNLLIPMVYIFIALSVAGGGIDSDALKEGKAFVKWLMTWVLKIILYVFTGYIAITGVVSGTADAAAVKAAKIAISGFVPVVGGIISDASEAILVSAGVMKNTAGIYGLLAVMAVSIGPFLQIGTQYVLLKLTAAAGSVVTGKNSNGLLCDLCSAMGFLLAMTGAVCLMLLISIVCFMKGVS
jgi:stage III sporulation protein AE